MGKRARWTAVTLPVLTGFPPEWDYGSLRLVAVSLHLVRTPTAFARSEPCRRGGRLQRRGYEMMNDE